MRIIRASNTRLRPDNIQLENEPQEKDRPRVHVWTAVGYNFKTKLYFYKIPININEKMTAKQYVQILNDVIKS